MNCNCKAYIIPGLGSKQDKIPVNLTGNNIEDPKFFKLKGPLSIQVVQTIVADAYGLTVDQMLTGGKGPEYSYPRMVSMFLCEKYLPYNNLDEIGKLHYKRDHCAVLHAQKKIGNFIDIYQDEKDKINEIEEIINQYTRGKKWIFTKRRRRRCR